MVGSGVSFLRAVWAWVGVCMVAVLEADFLKSMGEMGEVRESSSSLMAFGMEMPFGGVDCRIIAGRFLWEPLDTVKESTQRQD